MIDGALDEVGRRGWRRAGVADEAEARDLVNPLALLAEAAVRLAIGDAPGI
jgi:hypothetical protein